MLNSLVFFLSSWALSAEPISNIVCFNEVSNTLLALEVSQKWERIYSSPDLVFLKSSKHSKQDFNVWLGSVKDESILIIKKENTIIQHSFDQQTKCFNKKTIDSGDADKYFSALDFFKESVGHPKFVIVLWSPHMAISLHQVKDLKNKKLSVPVFYVLDEHANDTAAKNFIEKENLPTSYLKRWNYIGSLPSSIEHYPSFLFVKNGKIVGYVPGYSATIELEKLIRNYL